MRTLESMAAELFIKFSIKETGKAADWKYLSDARKLEWMKEVLIMANFFLNQTLNEIKPIPNNKKTDTSYAAGFQDGVRSERTYFHTLLENRYQKLVDEYHDLEYSLKKNT
jgi:hypothetical protein